MDPLSLGVGAASAGLGIWRGVSLWKTQINAHYFLAALKKLVASGNVARAIKLCSAAGNSTLANACKAGLLRSSDRGEGIDARRKDVIGAFNAAGDAGIKRLEKHALLGWAALGLGFMAIVLGLSASPLTPVAAALGGIGVFGALGSLVLLRRLRRDCRRVGTGLVEALEEAWLAESDKSSRNHDRTRREVDEIGADLGLVTPSKPSVASITGPRPAEQLDVTPEPIAEPPVLADMRNGRCALCRKTDIAEQPQANHPGFALFVCRSCGYAQLFAENPSAH